MKKLLFFLAACALSLSTFAASITASDIDFGTVSIKGVAPADLPLTGSGTVTVTWSGLTSEGATMSAVISEGLLDSETNPNGFTVDEPSDVYLGYGTAMVSSCTFTVRYSVKAAGTFTGKLHLYSQDTNWDQVDKYINLSITVTNEAIVAKVVPFERIEKTSDLHDGDTIIFVNEAAGAVSDCADGLKNSTSLTAITDNVIVNTTTHKASVPDNAVFLKLSKYGDYWQFINVKTSEKLLLDIGNAEGTGKGAFSYTEQTGVHLANWSIDITNGAATVGRLHDDDYDEVLDWSFLVRFMNGSSGILFKPYRTGADGSGICIYKKTGNAQEKQSSLTINPSTIDFGTVAYKSPKEIEISYTAENLEDDIVWEMAGTDAAKFQIIEDPNNTKESGTLTLKYLGTATSAAALSAKLTYTTVDAKLDYMEGEFPISISLIKLDGIAFTNTTYNATLQEGSWSLPLGGELTFDPSTVPSAGRNVTWKIQGSYAFGNPEVNSAGYFTADDAGNYVVVATSTIGDNIQAKCTVNVVRPAAASITLNKTTLTLHKSETFTLTASVLPALASQEVTYESDNTSIATVNTSGKITAKTTYGTANIIVKAKNTPTVTATCVVTVAPWTVENVAFDETSIQMVEGGVKQLNVVYTPTQAADENPATFESDKEDVATVDNDGKVTAQGAGTAIITVTAGGKTGTITINVSAPKWFVKVTTPSTLADKDTIVLANETDAFMAGEYVSSGTKMTPITEGVSVDDLYAYSDDAQRIVLVATTTSGEFKLKLAGTSTYLGGKASDKADITSGNESLSNNVWTFVQDGSNGVYVSNKGVSRCIAKNGNIIRLYGSSSSYPKLYVYFRGYKAPAAVENIEAERVPAQKLLHEGRIVILREGVMYELDGRRTK